MTEQNQARDLLATLRDALHKLEVNLGLTRCQLPTIFVIEPLGVC